MSRLKQALSGHVVAERLDLSVEMAVSQWHREIRLLAEFIQDALPEMIDPAGELGERLCPDHGIETRYLRTDPCVQADFGAEVAGFSQTLSDLIPRGCYLPCITRLVRRSITDVFQQPEVRNRSAETTCVVSQHRGLPWEEGTAMPD